MVEFQVIKQNGFTDVHCWNVYIWPNLCFFLNVIKILICFLFKWQLITYGQSFAQPNYWFSIGMSEGLNHFEKLFTTMMLPAVLVI